MKSARRLQISGVVQGVGFRPFVYRVAQEYGVTGWVLNGESGVVIHAEAADDALERFASTLTGTPPPAARIADVVVQTVAPQGFSEFSIRMSEKHEAPTVRIAADLPVCEDCLQEMNDPHDRRFGYPYINCTNCGPRYSIILALPYDRPNTTMRDWPLCALCEAEYHDPGNRRFHAQPVACPQCGPNYTLENVRGAEAIARAAARLRAGDIVGVKGLGGYHVACDARNAAAVSKLRDRKFRKEQPFAVMVASIQQARSLADLSPREAELLTSMERPIVLMPARAELPGVAPGNRDLGIMLPYTPLQHLLFAAGAPDTLVMTSGNRSSEPIAYKDEDAAQRLSGIADVLLVGEREIARRIDDSVARVFTGGQAQVLRHARGYAPRCVASIPSVRPILATGADLKNAVGLVVAGNAFVSQHIGDLAHYSSLQSFKDTISDLCAMYEVPPDDLLVAHDAHPQYASTQHALTLPGKHIGVQHHRAHIASVLAERGEWDREIIGVAFDGTGYGDDATIWGGEIFTGSLRGGLTRAIHLRAGALVGGDAAARHPVQCAAGFLAQLEAAPDFEAAPFYFPPRYRQARQLCEKNVRTFATTSMGRLFDTAAALCGFTREITFEGQAAVWLEQLASQTQTTAAYAMPLRGSEMDFRPLLAAIVDDRRSGRNVAEIARGFHAAIAQGVVEACAAISKNPVVASGGVFQNQLLAQMLFAQFGARLWLNANVPCNDGGISLGQAAIASLTVSA
ncbi:MAG: carbamoyltransferase HypF [Candidatus Eremiobacteraeota bacterium]|nr:carbamoyltransferase HypF [Candidatus Eremiobacteraeota bacterium]